MKTNQVMTRQMGNFEILQRTKDGMFNATLLLKQWNDQSVSNRNWITTLIQKRQKSLFKQYKKEKI